MVPTWVRLVDLPDKCWKPAALSKIASCLGNPICIDYMTNVAKKRDFARMLIEIDSSIPPVESIPILLPSGETIHQAVFYELYPCFCVNCKSSKHWVEKCPKLKGIPPSDLAFPPLKIVDCKRNGNDWRWNKEDMSSPDSVETETDSLSPVEGEPVASAGEVVGLQGEVVEVPAVPGVSSPQPDVPSGCDVLIHWIPNPQQLWIHLRVTRRVIHLPKWFHVLPLLYQFWMDVMKKSRSFPAPPPFVLSNLTILFNCDSLG
nr:MADS-box protein SOC1 isoform A [Ipomoea batatas]